MTPWASLVAQIVKNLSAMWATMGSIPWLGRSPREGNGNPLQYSCLENPMDGGAWQATVHGVTKSRIRLSNFTQSLGALVRRVGVTKGENAQYCWLLALV